MTRPGRNYVLQLVNDLLGVHGGRRTGPYVAAKGQLPAGVAARLALVIAAGLDPRVLTSDRKGTADQQAARKLLLREAVERADELDVRAPVTLPVRCADRCHHVQLDVDGELVALDHPDLDVDSERVFASLGGTLLPCLQALDGAGRRWAPPVADDGPRLVGIDAGELLAFVALCRQWVVRGHTLLSAAAALDAGAPYDQVQGHLDLGLDVADAVEWVGVPPNLAVRWHDIAFSRSDADLWNKQGRTLAEAEAATASAGNGRWLARWARVAGSRLSAEDLAGWASFGVPVGVWGEAASRGLPASEVPGWTAAGFQPVEVLRYVHLRVPLSEAVRWRDEGFTAYVATGYLGVGITLADALALRGLPVREVQDAWPRCRSVAAVLAELSS